MNIIQADKKRSEDTIIEVTYNYNEKLPKDKKM